MEDNRVITSYVVNGENGFRISTAERSSSSPYAMGNRYFETLVFNWDYETKATGKLIYQDCGGIDHHVLCVLHLFNNGNLDGLDTETAPQETLNDKERE